MIFQKIQKVKETFLQHKLRAAIAIIAVVFGGYYFYQSLNKTQTATRYVLGSVKKENLIISISGGGQVATSNQAEVKTKVSGEVTYVGVVDGQAVKAGAVLAYIDSRDAQKAVKDAQTSLETSRLALDKLLAPVDQLTIMQSEDSIIQAKQAKQDAQDNLKNMADDEFNTISNSFLELPSIMTGLNSILFSKTMNSGQWNLDYYADMVKTYDDKALQYRTSANNSYLDTRAAYDKNFADYKAVSRYSDAGAIEALLDETYETERSISDAVKSSNNLIQFYQDTLNKYSGQDPVAASNTHLSSLSSYTGKVNAHLTNLSSLRDKIKSYKKTIADSDRTIIEKQLSFDKVKAGPDELDIRSGRLAAQDKENALAQVRENLADYTVRAPFDGIISAVNVKKGDIAGATALATLISSQQIAQISLNEIDTAKVKVGQKATLTFDAIDGLGISGQVAQIDITGMVSQGVVSYGVQIAFDTQDDRIKPGMSVSASIITDFKQDVLVVSNSAIKNQGDIIYVEIVSENLSNSAIASVSGVLLSSAPNMQPIEAGLANDTITEIVSGLKEGDTIVAQTINSSATATSASSQNSGLRIPGLTGGEAMRAGSLNR